MSSAKLVFFGRIPEDVNVFSKIHWGGTRAGPKIGHKMASSSFYVVECQI